jgi:VanZ family protein
VRRYLKIAAWLLLLTILVLSLVPPAYRPATDMPHFVEHFGIFLATGIAFALGYCTTYWLQFVPLIAFTAAIEFAQLWIPGRHARLSDFIVNALGVSLGLGFDLARTRVIRLQSQRV